MGPFYVIEISYDSDGFLVIHVCEWRLDSLNSTAALSNSRLLRNLGSANPGVFEDVTVEAGVALDAVRGTLRDPQNGTFSFSSSIVDMDGDSHPDLIIAADFGESRLFWNNGDGTFTDGTAAAGVGLDENGMGSAVGDINGDGLLDWFVTSISGGLLPPYTGNFMYLNNGDRTFTDYTEAAGVRNGFWGWGATFLDYDNDGDLDLTMVNGFPNSVFSLISCCNPMRFWENDGSGHFTEISLSVGLLDARQGKGILSFDYDNDGDLDLFVTNNASTPVLYNNDGTNAGDWLRIEFDRAEPFIGARIVVTAEVDGPEQLPPIFHG